MFKELIEEIVEPFYKPPTKRDCFEFFMLFLFLTLHIWIILILYVFFVLSSCVIEFCKSSWEILTTLFSAMF